MNDIFKRRTIRIFNNEKIKQEDIMDMLKAAGQAPSSKNNRPWQFIIVDMKYKNDLMKMSTGAKNLRDAQAIIAFIADLSSPTKEFIQQDLSGAINYFLLEAYNKGIGGVWIGTYPVEERYTYANTILEVKEPFTTFALVGIGYPQDSNFQFADRPIEQLIHIGKW